jgi:hypothetical protein
VSVLLSNPRNPNNNTVGTRPHHTVNHTDHDCLQLYTKSSGPRLAMDRNFMWPEHDWFDVASDLHEDAR